MQSGRTDHRARFAAACAALPLIAILRGVRPDTVERIADGLVDAGFTMIEIPLNSPDPFESIARLSARLDARVVVGAGTVLDAESARRACAAGAGLLLAPNLDLEMLAAAHALDLATMPGVATATEAFAAIRAGASALKLFPANVLGAGTISAWRAVLPAVPIFGVGGVDERHFAAFVNAGATGFGLGSSLYRAGDDAAKVAAAGARAVQAWRDIDARDVAG